MDTRTEVIYWNLEGLHLVLFVTAIAVWVDAWHFVAVQNLKKAFASEGCHASRDTIGRHTVDPNDLFSHFDSSLRSFVVMSTATEHLRELAYVRVDQTTSFGNTYLGP